MDNNVSSSGLQQYLGPNELFQVFQKTARRAAIRAVGKGWDRNRRESEFWQHYWGCWLEMCTYLKISETWWIKDASDQPVK